MNEHLTTTVTVYYIILFSMIIFFTSYWFVSNNKLVGLQQKSIFTDYRFWIPCLIYTILLGYRWDFAYDWWQYYQTFEFIQHGALYRDNTEKGYLAINYILGYIGLNYYSIFILECFVYFSSVFLLLKHNRKALLIGLCLVFIAMRFRTLNLSRQHFAMSFLWIGFYFLLKDKLKNYILFAILACSIHTSAILWSVPMFFASKMKKFISLKAALIVFILCYVFKAIVFDYILNTATFFTTYFITNKSYDTAQMLSDTFMWEEQSNFRLLIDFFKGFAYIMCMYYCLKKKYIDNNKDYIILVLGYIGLCLTIFGTSHEIVSRFMLYLSVFTYLGWGIISVHLIKGRKNTPWYILIFAIITLAHYLYSMYPVIEHEVENGCYIEYKNTIPL